MVALSFLLYYQGFLEIYSNDVNQSPYIVTVQGSGQNTMYPMGTMLWQYTLTDPYDDSPKAISAIPDINEDGVDDVIICSEDDFIRCFNGNDDGIGAILWEREIY